MLVLLGLVAALWGALAWARWSRARRHWEQLGVPHDPPSPLLGSLSFFMRGSPAAWFRKYYERYRGSPYVGIWLLWQPALIINCPTLARRILVTDFDYFRDRNLGPGGYDVLGSKNLLTANDPLWSILRKKLSLVFTSAKLKTVQPTVSEKAHQLVARIREETDAQRAINLRRVFADYSTDVISAALLGIPSEATRGGRSALRDVTEHFLHFSLYRGFAWSSVFFLPKVASIFRLPFFPKPATDELRPVLRAVMAQRALPGHTRDMVDALVRLTQEDIGEPVSEDLLLAQAAILLQGGFETTSLTLTYAIYELAHNQTVQDKLYKGLREALGPDPAAGGARRLDDDVLSRVPYLTCVIKETLRKYTPMGWVDRVATRGYRVDDLVTLAAGTPVFVNSAGLHHDPDYFPQPNRFEPERFLAERAAELRPYTYMPFGEGPRRCIGERLALQAVRAALAAVVLGAELHPWPGAPAPDQCNFETAGILLIPSSPLSINFILRV